MGFVEVFLLLIAGHFVADYALQGDAIAVGKNRKINPKHFGVNWWYWMTAHVAVQGMAVGLITQSVWLGVAEAIAHFIIDVLKCEGKIDLHTDQLLHVLCKLAWALIFVTGPIAAALASMK